MRNLGNPDGISRSDEIGAITGDQKVTHINKYRAEDVAGKLSRQQLEREEREEKEEKDAKEAQAQNYFSDLLGYQLMFGSFGWVKLAAEIEKDPEDDEELNVDCGDCSNNANELRVMVNLESWLKE